MLNKNIYDVVIIGGGLSALTLANGSIFCKESKSSDNTLFSSFSISSSKMIGSSLSSSSEVLNDLFRYS